jgi:NAD(P)H dehydrogenase (quinone)
VGESDVYELTGPNTQTHTEIAAAITAAIGRQVRYEDLPVPEEAEHLVRLGIPEPYATQRAGLMKDLGDNRWADTTPTVETVTGRKPRSLADFLSDHAAAFGQ